MSQAEGERLDEVISAFCNRRSKEAHEEYQVDLPSEEFYDKLELAVRDAREVNATLENGLMIRRRLNEVKASFDVLRKRAPHLFGEGHDHT